MTVCDAMMWLVVMKLGFPNFGLLKCIVARSNRARKLKLGITISSSVINTLSKSQPAAMSAVCSIDTLFTFELKISIFEHAWILLTKCYLADKDQITLKLYVYN